MSGRPQEAWPARLDDGDLVLRPLTYGDAAAWREVRSRNRAWLQPWDATLPPGIEAGPRSFRGLVWRMKRIAAAGQGYPFAIEVDGAFAGQVTVSNVVRGSAQMGSVGYWIDRDVAGRGLMPRAVAMVIDHCFATAGLHRLEIAIRPENSNSLRVVEKLGLHEVGFAPRFLHIDGGWRDHRVYAITVEECDVPVRSRLDAREQPHE